MGLAISSLFTKLFGKKNMRILMGMTQYSTRESRTMLPYKLIHVFVLHNMLVSTILIHKLAQCPVCRNVKAQLATALSVDIYYTIQT